MIFFIEWCAKCNDRGWISVSLQPGPFAPQGFRVETEPCDCSAGRALERLNRQIKEMYG